MNNTSATVLALKTRIQACHVAFVHKLGYKAWEAVWVDMHVQTQLCHARWYC